ncbi:uncharacterized protein LAESUDRAFT_811136 [Laetiporus sulphureus 93-53]|uniref:F-box domain-containing protein n=1 Tax=Laetiporus sulphureus 93-53 TaxID=1314785 RepID=A0A165FJQ2_9APHY|nr:uncharacterized protein LAESUDRAFT_811136 [Laetiporus sulphureus 93-53]KZT09075.1 hypothetical protein LAESUDRAFT_811136 [Laetiporus sulphureus 93-53]
MDALPSSMLNAMTATQLAKETLAKVKTEHLLSSNEKLQDLSEVLMRSMSIVRSTLNSRVPINRLPPEVLGMIFEFVPEFPSDESLETLVHRIWGPSSRNPEDSLILSHVCRHWRAVATGLPTLWTSIDGTLAFPPSTILKRAGSLPRNIFLLNEISNFVDYSFFDGPNFRELLWDSVDIEEMTECLQSPAPMLENLALKADIPIHSANHVHRKSFSLFMNETPRLRRLALECFPVLPTNRFTGLTHLHLASCVGAQILSGILSMLAGTPGLLELTLYGIVVPFGSPQSNLPTAELKHLRRFFYFEMAPAVTSLLLSHISLAPETAVFITYARHESRILVPQVQDFPSMQDVTKLFVRVARSGIVVAAVSSTSGVMQELRPICLHYNSIAALETLATSIPMAQIREMWILDDSHEFEDLLMYEWLGTADSIETLVMFDHSVSSIIQSVAWARDRQSIAKNSLPTLRVLLRDPLAASIAMAEIVEHHEEHGFTHLCLEYLPKFRGESVDHMIPRGLFQSVEIEHLTAKPEMAMPEICRTTAHDCWPPWDDVLLLPSSMNLFPTMAHPMQYVGTGPF